MAEKHTESSKYRDGRPLLAAQSQQLDTRLGRFWITVTEATIHKNDFKNNRELIVPTSNRMEHLRGTDQVYNNTVYVTPPLTPPNSGVATPVPSENTDKVVVGDVIEPEDVWALPELEPDEERTPWKDQTCVERLRTVGDYVLRALALTMLLYLFICSLGLLGSAFQLLGGRTTGRVFRESELLQNPICGLMIGVLTTVLLQSSSTSTSIVVGLVASEILPVRSAIPIVMGANIGTSMTNTLVSMGHSGRRNEFRRAFAAATVHDMFNWLCVLLLLPLEVVTGYLYHVSGWLISLFHLSKGEKPPKMLKYLTDPFNKLIIQLDKSKIKKIATGEVEPGAVSLVKRKCDLYVRLDDINIDNQTNNTIETENAVKICTGKHIFGSLQWSDSTIGLILLIVSLVVLCVCLFAIVKLLHSTLKGQLARTIRRFVNNDLPGRWKCLTGYLAILVGCVMTILVQSSSIVTSALTPLVGVGVLTVDRMYPLTLGANVGTTCTSILAALASDHIDLALQIALCHLFFNLTGIIMFYVIWPMRSLPTGAAKVLGNTTAKYRWFAALYIVLSFVVLPSVVFGLSMLGTNVALAVGLPFVVLMLAIIVVNVIQAKRATLLPQWLRDWSFLPRPCRSLQPYDAIITRLFTCCAQNGGEPHKTDRLVRYTPGQSEIDLNSQLKPVLDTHSQMKNVDV